MYIMTLGLQYMLFIHDLCYACYQKTLINSNHGYYPFKQVHICSSWGCIIISCFRWKKPSMMRWFNGDLLGDLSYADGFGPRWDSFGRLFERLGASTPMAYCPGSGFSRNLPSTKTGDSPKRSTKVLGSSNCQDFQGLCWECGEKTQVEIWDWCVCAARILEPLIWRTTQVVGETWRNMGGDVEWCI